MTDVVASKKCNLLPVEQRCLRQRIQNFIISGGVSPLLLDQNSVFDSSEKIKDICQRLVRAGGQLETQNLRFAGDCSWSSRPNMETELVMPLF